MVMPFTAAAAHFARALGTTGYRSHLASVLFGIILWVILLLFFSGILPVCVLYLGAWFSALLSFGALGSFSKRATLIANTVTLCFTLACSLLLFGYLSILETTGANADVLDGEAGLLPTVQALIATSLLVASVFALLLAHVLKDAYPATEHGDRALRQFRAFVLFAIVYELLDLAPFSFHTWFVLMPYFLFGGSIILTLLCLVFSLFTAFLGAEAFRESENIALERRKRSEELLMSRYRQEATTDPLTGLAVRRIGHEYLERLEKSETPYLAVFIDVNSLKKTNDVLGHAAGDACLVAFSNALSSTFPESQVTRWGGDEFLVIAAHGDKNILKSRLDALNVTASTPEGDCPVRFCYGIASSAEGDADTVLRRADDAMYRSKRIVHEAATMNGDNT